MIEHHLRLASLQQQQQREGVAGGKPFSSSAAPHKMPQKERHFMDYPPPQQPRRFMILYIFK